MRDLWSKDQSKDQRSQMQINFTSDQKEQSYQWDLRDQREFQPHTVYNLGFNKTITVSMISAIKAIIKGNIRGSKYKEPQPAGSKSKV